VLFKHLPELKKRIDALEADLAALRSGAAEAAPSDDEEPTR